MGREIKVRGWSDETGMLPSVDLSAPESTFNWLGKFDCEITQYTGLKDKSGVEIYEGDIVKWDDCSDGRYWRVAIVELDPALQFKCFNCPLIENDSAHGHIFKFGGFIYTDTHNHLEIIGNIHENPELLGELSRG